MDKNYKGFYKITLNDIKEMVGYNKQVDEKLNICFAPFSFSQKPNSDELKVINEAFNKNRREVLVDKKDESLFVVNYWEEQYYIEKGYGRIRNTYRVSNPTIYETMYYILKGRTFLTGYTQDGRKHIDWISSNVVGIDIDDGLTMEEALARCDRYGIRPAFIYPTFNHMQEYNDKGELKQKFRMIFVLNKVNTSIQMQKLLLRCLTTMFPEYDEHCTDLTRLWHGTNKGWLMIDGELEELHKKSLTHQQLLKSLYQWAEELHDDRLENILRKNICSCCYVPIKEGKLDIDMEEDGDTITVNWRNKECNKKYDQQNQIDKEHNAYENISTSQMDSLVVTQEEISSISIQQIEDECYLYKQAKKGDHWLYEPELIHLITNLFMCSGVSEDLKKIIMKYPEYYNNDKLSQSAYIQKIDTVPQRFTHITNCTKGRCQYCETDKCKGNYKNIISRLKGSIEENSIECVDAEKNRQLELLRDEILQTHTFNMHSKIKVFSIEASVGKTWTVIQALKQIAVDVKVLLVTKLIDEQYRLKEELEQALGSNVMLINSQTPEATSKEIQETQVLIITHAKYKNICMKEDAATIYHKGRHLLIIDESIDLLNYYSVSINTINNVVNILELVAQDDSLWKKYVEIVRPIKDLLHSRFEDAGDVRWIPEEFIDIDIEQKVQELVNQVKQHHIPMAYFEKFEVKSKDELIAHLYALKFYYNNPKILSDKQHVYSSNIGIQHRSGFNKIILLDASAKFMEIYKSEKFDVKQMDRVINHYNTVLTHGILNTTKISKLNDPQQIEIIKEYINTNTSDTDKVLIIGSKKEAEHLNCKCVAEKTDIVTFAGSRGKNDWADYNKVFIIHTPGMNIINYIFQYLHYFEDEAEKIVGDDEAISFKKGDGGLWTFIKNERLHKLRLTDIASDVYQAVKRIDRNHKERLENVEYHILCSNFSVVDIVKGQLKNLKSSNVIELKERKKEMLKRLKLMQ